MRKRTTAILGALMVMIIATGVVLASHQFPDVPDDHTFHTDIDWLVTNGITTGYPNGNFGPEDNVTRGQMSAFLHRYNTEFTEYGIGAIVVTKGGGLPVPHTAYSTTLGSPVADTTGGVFRMTCDADEAPCTIAVKAAALSNGDIGGTVRFLPRVLVMRGGHPVAGAAPDIFCEYADGAGAPAGLFNLTKQALAAVPDFEDLSIDIGGTADCGVAGPGGAVAAISVPEGFYDIHASFAFFEVGAP